MYGTNYNNAMPSAQFGLQSKQAQMQQMQMLQMQAMGMGGMGMAMNDDFFYKYYNYNQLSQYLAPHAIEMMTVNLQPVSNPEEYPNPVKHSCQSCGTLGWTRTGYKCGATAVCWGVFLSMGLSCFLPCCMDVYKDVEHSCGNCSRNLGVYKRPCCLRPT